MPGLVGLITRMPEQQARRQLAQMVKAIHHEPFYVCGTWADPSMGVYVGWVARQGSFAESMPLQNERTDVTLVFSGEDYPEPGIPQALGQRGHTLPPEGPAYLVHLYEEDPAFFAGLNGLFHGLVVDHSLGNATLFIDRYGMHRVYVHESKDAFYFAAEAKAILAVCPETRALNQASVGEFVSFGCTLQNRSLFERVQLLPPASAWVFRDGMLTRRQEYFDPKEWEQQERLDPESYYREMRSVISRVLPRYLRREEPVGIALTGGLDTRVIMAWSKASPGALPCYTFGGMVRESHDVRIGRQVAGLCNQKHEVITVGQEFLSRFDHYSQRTAFLAEGCVSVANSPDLYVSERAREIAPAKIVGTWGSELLRQATTFKPIQPFPGLYDPELLKHVANAEATYANVRQGNPISFAAFRQTPWAQYGIEALEQTQVAVHAPFLANEFVRMVYRCPAPNRADIRDRLVVEGNPTLASIPSDRGVRLDSTGIAATTSRVLRELSFKCEYAFDMGMPQWLARVDHAVSPLRLDRLFCGRHKFLHFRTWYRDRLSDYVRQVLLDPLTLSRSFLRKNEVENVVASHLIGRGNHTTTIHSLLTLELVHRQFARS
jgi:asparagine synthase (glutamine-hydrolysing)